MTVCDRESLRSRATRIFGLQALRSNASSKVMYPFPSQSNICQRPARVIHDTGATASLLNAHSRNVRLPSALWSNVSNCSLQQSSVRVPRNVLCWAHITYRQCAKVSEGTARSSCCCQEDLLSATPDVRQPPAHAQQKKLLRVCKRPDHLIPTMGR